MLTMHAKYTLLFISSSCLYGSMSDSEWTWHYKKIFSPSDCMGIQRKSALLEKSNVPKFTQLIFSWNAFKPTKGFYRFWVQVRDEQTKKWYPWHKALDWGNTVNQSYCNKTREGTSYHHVRLELPSSKYGDALRLRIENHEGASFNHLKQIFVCISDLTKYSNELQKNIGSLQSYAIKNVPRQSQMVLEHLQKETLCSPTSCSMMLSYLLKKPIDPLNFSQEVYDHGLNAYGSWPFNVAAAFLEGKGAITCAVTRLPSFNDLYAYLSRNIPVVVSVRGRLTGAVKEYTHGHLLVVIGWDAKKKVVICHDPAFEKNEHTVVRYDINSFLEAWGRSKNLAYIAEPAM